MGKPFVPMDPMSPLRNLGLRRCCECSEWFQPTNQGHKCCSPACAAVRNRRLNLERKNGIARPPEPKQLKNPADHPLVKAADTAERVVRRRPQKEWSVAIRGAAIAASIDGPFWFGDYVRWALENRLKVQAA